MSRTEKEILQDVQRAAEKLHALAMDKENTTLAQIETANAEFKAFRNELEAYVSNGAKPCPGIRLKKVSEDSDELSLQRCDAKPMGMLKTPAYTDRDGDHEAIWEVGCVFCSPVLVARETGQLMLIGDEGEAVRVKRRSFSARSTVPAEAVRKWNAGEWVEDLKFEFTPNAQFVASEVEPR